MTNSALTENRHPDVPPVDKVEWIDLYDRRPSQEDGGSQGDVMVWWSDGDCTWEPWDSMPAGGTEYPTHWARFPWVHSHD